MSTKKDITLTDYVDVLNAKATEINKYEGFYPDRFLIDNNSAKEMTLQIIPTSGEESSVPNYEIKISKLSPYDKNWFAHAAEAQITVYQSVIDVLKELNKNNKFYKFGDDGKFHMTSKKTKNNALVEQELELIELNTFRSLDAFRNYSIADFIKPIKEETIDSIKEKTNELVDSIRDSIARLKFIDLTPNFNLSATIKENDISCTVSIDNEKIVAFNTDWTKVKLDKAYNNLVTLCYANRATLNTLEFYRFIIGITEPRLYVSKMLSKKLKITRAGQQYMTCLEIVNLLKEVFGFKPIDKPVD